MIIAINIQENPLIGGGDEKMLEIISKARARNIPIIHACSRKRLGKVIMRFYLIFIKVSLALEMIMQGLVLQV